MTDRNDIDRGKTGAAEETPKRYEEDLGAYLHLKIEEEESPELALEKKVVPETIRRRAVWRTIHTRRKVLISKTAEFFKDTRKMVVIWILLMCLGALGVYLDWDTTILGGTMVVFGILSSAFAWLWAALLGSIALVPFVGPAMASILSSSLLWIINALGYFVSIIAIKAGHGKTVLNYRLLVVVFLIGMVMGYVVGRMF